MNTTFTTCAEKKAKQFLNLLQGYTKGIRMTAILILLLMGVSNIWAATTATLYYSVPAGTVGCYTVKCYYNFGYNQTGLVEMTKVDKTSNGNLIYSVQLTANNNNVDNLLFQLFDGNTWKSEQQVMNGWTPLANNSGKMYVHNTGWKAYSTDASYTVYFVNKDSWIGTIKAYAWNSDCDKNKDWYGADMTSTGKTYQGKNIYSITLNKRYANIIFNNGSSQTGDLTLGSTNIGKMYDGSSWITYNIDPIVTFKANGGTGSDYTQTVKYNTNTALAANDFTRTNYTFAGWNTKADGSGTSYTDKQTIKLTANTTLYAQWTPVNYTITYNTNGGSGTMTPTTYTVETETFNLPTPTKAGSTFEGWYTTSNFSGSKVTQITKGSTGDKTLYAKWGQNAQPSITISTEKTYLRTAYDKLTLNIDYSNIPEGHTYRVHATPEAYFNGNENGDNIDRVSISGNGKTTFVSHGYLAQNTYTVEVILWDNNSATTIKSNQITIIVEPQLTVQTRARFNNQISTTAAEHPQPEWVHPSQNIGETITANNPNQGYTFAGWIANDDNLIEFEDPNSLTTIVKSKVNGNNTAVAYADYVKETCVYFINTSEWNEVAVYAWNEGGSKNKDWPGQKLDKTGEQIGGYDVYKYCTQYEKLIFNNNNNNGQQTGDLTWETGKYYVYDTWYEREEVEQALQDMQLYTDYYLVGAMNSWNQNSHAFKKATTEANTASVTFSLAANTTYEFKVKIKNGHWFGYNGDAINATTSDLQFINNGGENCSLKTTIEGEYTFTWNLTNSKLSVQYPTPIQYNITYHLNGGTNPNDAPTSYNVTTATFNLPAPTKTGYTFAGWFDNEELTGEPITTIPQGSTGNKTFYAKWTINSHNVTWKANGGNWSGNTNDIVDSYNYGATITKQADPTRTGYNFAGWSPNFNANTTMPDEDLTYTAQWTTINYTITYNTNGGNSIEQKTYTITTETFNLPTPNKTGYTFAGWFDNEELTGYAVTQFTKGTTGNKTFYAKWTATEYTITYNDLYGVTHTNPTIYTIESEAITFTNPTSERTGYTFKGWNPTGIEKGSTGNKTITAQWTEILSTITITTNPAEGGSIEVDGQPFTPGHTVQVGVTTTKQVTTIPNEGYGVTSWAFKGAAEWKGGQNTVTLASDGSGETGELIANYIPLSRNIQFDKQSGEGGTETATVTYTQNNYSPASVVAPTRTGYTFGGYHSEEKGAGEQVVSAEGAWLSNANGYTDADGNWLKSAENTTLYAQWTANTYTVTLEQGSATTPGTTSVIATYDADMPSATMPTKTGYVFGGYYDQQNGQGTQYYDANGASARTWNKADNTTLYAYFVTPQIEVTLNGSTFEPGTASVTATATVTPAPADGTTVICWSLLYSGSENEVAGHEPTPTNGNSVQFSISDLAAGSYIIKAILREGTGCEGTEISSATKTFLITSSHTITIKYTCDGKEIQASTTQEAQVSSETTITAPEIIGYNFKEWVAGDGVSIQGATDGKKNTATIEFTAYYDGNLTATYTKNENIIYFYNTLGWQNVYVYFYNGDYWDISKGSGAKTGGTYQGYAKMTQIAGTDIWYVNASGKSTTYLAFCKDQQDTYDFFFATEVVRRGDYNSKLPMFVPIADQKPEEKNVKNNDKTLYYNKGYWMNYPNHSGYTLDLFNHWEHNDPARYIIFPYSENTIFPLQVKVELNNENIVDGKHKVWFRIYRNDGIKLGKVTTNSITYQDNDEFIDNENSDNKIELNTNAAGIYTFTIDYKDATGNGDYKYYINVEYPVEVGDYRVIYKDKAQWSQTAAHGDNWYHPSYAIKQKSSATDIVSFFIAKDNSPAMKFQRCTAISGQTVTWADVANGTITIPNEVVTAAGVYNFIVKQPAEGTPIYVESVEPYTGNYYIRCDAVGGKWDNYKTDKENRMTYSAFSESDANSFGDKYSHYVTKFCEKRTNIKFTIANDYSPCITDTLTKDILVNGNNPFDNLDNNGTIKDDDKYKANVRFMWNRKTNRISRAYIGPAGDEVADRQFLILKADKEIKNASGGTLSNKGDNHNAHQAIFSDTQNWIYERTIQVKPKTRVKLYACYPEVDPVNAQYFCGAYNTGSFTDDKDSKLALGGDANDQNYYSIRVLYDFKTNRLLMAWMPSGDTENVTGTKNISADVMLIRDHQNPAQCITFANEDSKLSEVKTVYGSMRFNRWVLNNRANPDDLNIDHCSTVKDNNRQYDEEKVKTYHPVLPQADQKSQYERALYFISFPFDVNVSDIFGFGTYGQHWIIEYYDGLKRAREGYWIDSDPNWKYVTNPDEFVLEKYKGYILCLNLGKMAYNNTDFWAHNISQVELFFPSTTTMSEIKRTEVTMPELGDEYLCKINRNTPEGDRRVKDSYWRCIGVPSYANYSNILTTDGEQHTIEWQTNYEKFPFLYAWNMTDNTLTPQSTNRFNFKTMHAYLVQNGGEIHWSAVSATPNPSNIVARRQAASEINNYEWKLTLSRNEQIEDQAFVRLSDNEQITTEFDFNQDLSKEFNYGRSDIYTLIGYEKAAANSLPITETTTLIPLGLSIEYNGDYTIAMPDRMENIGVTLIDTESNTRTNLSAGMEYVVTLNKGDYNNRFFIEISPIQQTPTDIEYVTGDSNNQDSVRKVLIDNILYIVRDGQIFDARGARVK